MGLIKTALLLGGGYFIAKKVASGVEHHESCKNQNHNHNQNQNQNRNQSENYRDQRDYSPERSYKPNQPQIRYNENGTEQNWESAPRDINDRQAVAPAYYDDKASKN